MPRKQRRPPETTRQRFVLLVAPWSRHSPERDPNAVVDPRKEPRMRTSRVGIAAAVVLAAAVAAPVAQANAPENVPVQFGAPGSGAPAPIEDSIAPSSLHLRAGGRVIFNVDGFHQPVAYRLGFGESFADAFARLDARVDDTDAKGAVRLRMAGQNTFVPAVAGAPATDDRLTLRDLFSGYLYLGPVKVPPPFVGTEISPPALPGRYILLCNIPGHYKGVTADGQQFSMRATLVVD